MGHQLTVMIRLGTPEEVNEWSTGAVKKKNEASKRVNSSMGVM